MSTAKNKVKRSRSLSFKLTVPTSLLFILFVGLISLIAIYVFSSSVEKQTMNEVKKSSQQTISNYETYFESVSDVANNVQEKIDGINLSEEDKKEEISGYFDDFLLNKKEIKSMGIYSDDASLIVANSANSSDTAHPSDERFYKAYSDQLIQIYSRLEKSDMTYAFTLSKYVSYANGTEGGVLKVDFDFTKIITLISQTDFGDGGHMTIYDRDYAVVYTSAEDLDQDNDETEFIENLVMGVRSYQENGKRFVLYTSTINKTMRRVAIFTNVDSLDIMIDKFLLYVISIAVVVSLVFTVTMILVARSLTRPIGELKREMAEVESLNYLAETAKPIKGSREVEDLSNSFSQMMLRIKELMERIINEQEEQKKSELKALQNQINPHFLYNTFDSIIYMIDKGESEKAEEMIVALSKFFRISVSKGRNVIPLSSELDHAMYYLKIQKMRFGDSFSYSFDVEDGLGDYKVIKLILQPLIENAINHGISKIKGVGNIKISAKKADGFLTLSIEDNGYGILAEKIEEIYKSFNSDSLDAGVGIKNVYQRLRIYYGEKADIKIASVLDKGSKVTIYIPLNGGLKDEE